MKQGEEKSKELTETKDFVPTPAMRIWLETAIELTTDSPKEIAEASQLSRAVWYEWLKVPGFEDWYWSNYKQQRRRWLPKLDAMGMANAKKDFNFWKEMNRKAGDGAEEGNKVQVNFVQTIQQQKDKYGV